MLPTKLLNYLRLLLLSPLNKRKIHLVESGQMNRLNEHKTKILYYNLLLYLIWSTREIQPTSGITDHSVCSTFQNDQALFLNDDFPVGLPAREYHKSNIFMSCTFLISIKREVSGILVSVCAVNNVATSWHHNCLFTILLILVNFKSLLQPRFLTDFHKQGSILKLRISSFQPCIICEDPLWFTYESQKTMTKFVIQVFFCKTLW